MYYHLGEYDESMMFALGAGELFNITAKEEYVETIICTVPTPPPLSAAFAAAPAGRVSDMLDSKMHRRIHCRNIQERYDTTLSRPQQPFFGITRASRL